MLTAPDILRPEPVEAACDAALSPVEAAEVAAFVRTCPSGTYLQRPDWPDLHQRARRHTYRCLRVRSGGALIATALVRLSRLAPGAQLASIRRGPVTRDLEALRAAMPALVGALRAEGACTLVLNPRWEGMEAAAATELLLDMGGSVLPDAEQSLHRATAMIELSGDEAALWSRLKQRGRRQIRKAERMGLEVRPAATREEAMAFEPILARFHAERNLAMDNVPTVAAQWEMTRERGAFLLARRAGALVAGHTVLAEGSSGFWLSLASNSADADLPKNYPLLWAAMRQCQQQGLARYDMAGAPSPTRLAAGNMDREEADRFQFKASFAPEIVELTPMICLPLRRPQHDILFPARQSYRRWRRGR